MRAKSFQQPVARQRVTAVIDDRHLQSIFRVTSNWGINLSSTGQHALTDAQIAAVDFAALQLCSQRGMGSQRARDNEEPAGILVEPMHDTGTRHPGQRRVQAQQRILQRARAISRAGVYNQADGFIDHEHRCVLMNYREWNRFRRDRHDGLDLRIQHDLLATVDLLHSPSRWIEWTREDRASTPRER